MYGTYIYIPKFTIKKKTTIHVGSLNLNIPYMDPMGMGMYQASTTPPSKKNTHTQTLCNKQRTPMVSKALVKSFPEFKPQVVKTESQQVFFLRTSQASRCCCFCFLVVSVVSHMIWPNGTIFHQP